MSSDRRVTIVNNARTEDAKVILLKPSVTLRELLRIATTKLEIGGSGAVKCFLEDGGLVDDADLLRDNDTVFVSCGEPFHKHISGFAPTSGGGAGGGGAYKQKAERHSIAIMGPGAVGKSAITLQYAQRVFIRDYDPTIEDVYRKNTAVDGIACLMDVLDTAGQEDYVSLRATWMRDRNGFLLVYSMCDRSTFNDLQSFLNQLLVMHEDSETGLPPPIIVVANKSDMAASREVSEEEGRALAVSFGLDAEEGYIETSAKTGHNVDVAFTRLVRQIRQARPAATSSTAAAAEVAIEKKKKGFLSWCSIL